MFVSSCVCVCVCVKVMKHQWLFDDKGLEGLVQAAGGI